MIYLPQQDILLRPSVLLLRDIVRERDQEFVLATPRLLECFGLRL